MSRIAETFRRLSSQNRKALIPFITAGGPHPLATVQLMHALVAAGGDIIELGVPFSDPMADGPAIQRASERALKHGMSLNTVLDLVSEFRERDQLTPVVLMGYANPVEAMGHEAFASRAGQCGVDGILVVDYPPEESGPLQQALVAHGIDMIFLLAPTSTDERIRQIARAAQGYIYYVSLRGVTGAANLDLNDIRRRLPNIRRFSTLPIGVGFGIRDGKTAREVAEFADAIVIGSRLVQEMESAGPGLAVERAMSLLADIRKAMDATP